MADTIEIIAQVKDADGDSGSTSVRIDGETTIDGITGFAQAWLSSIENLTLGLWDRVIAYFRGNVGSLTSNTLDPSADVEQIGKFVFLSEIGTRVNINIPCLKESAGIGFGFDELDQEQADVAAFISACVDGIDIGGITVHPTDVRGMQLTNVLIAREASRNSGKRA